VYLHDLLFDQDARGFRERVERFLDLADAVGIRTMFVLFDDVWSPSPVLGPQAAPVPGRHNSRWVKSPGLPVLARYASDAGVRARLEAYVRGVVEAFGEDERVVVWDLYNEPGGFSTPGAEPVGERCLPLLRDVFDWAQSVSPRQPLTAGLWWNPLHPLPQPIHDLLLGRSDIVSFHHYGPAEDLEDLYARLRGWTERPLLCTEYMARNLESRFETHLPLFEKWRVGAICWGLVAGKTQTIHPWWSWLDDAPAPEPEVWFHDILRPDGAPHDPAEVDFLRGLLCARADGQ
jgi:hypothetical protein